MIWVKSFPMPPSVNEYLFAAATGKTKYNPRTGRKTYEAHLVKSKSHRLYTEECQWWAKANWKTWNPIRDHLQWLKKTTEANRQPFALRVDCYAVFHVERIFTVNWKCEPLDANNRLKPLLDGLVAVLGIDDKHFFGGNCEKVYAQRKDKECTILRISPMRPRSLEEIERLISQETSSPAS